MLLTNFTHDVDEIFIIIVNKNYSITLQGFFEEFGQIIVLLRGSFSTIALWRIPHCRLSATSYSRSSHFKTVCCVSNHKAPKALVTLDKLRYYSRTGTNLQMSKRTLERKTKESLYSALLKVNCGAKFKCVYFVTH